MGGGGSKPAAGEADEQKVERLEKELKQLQEQETSEQKRLDAATAEYEKTKEAMAKMSEGVVSVCTLATGAQLAKLKAMGVAYTVLAVKEEDLREGEETPVILSMSAADVRSVMPAVGCAAEVVRKPKMVPDPPEIPTEEEGAKKKEEEEKKEEKKFEMPKVAVKSESAIMLRKGWEGKSTVKFTWTNDPTPFSEFNDPTGLNWWCKTNVRRAPGVPQSVKVEWRQGMNDTWKVHPAAASGDSFEATLEITPTLEEKEGKKEQLTGAMLRGFQSRWLVDGVRYLSPIHMPPDLFVKCNRIPPVRAALKALPPEKRSFDQIPQEQVRNGLMSLDNMLPMNTWDVTYCVERVPGVYINGEHIMSMGEKVEFLALEKSNDPAIKSEVRKMALKTPFLAVNALLGQVGIKLSAIIANADAFFFPKLTEPKFEALQAAEDERIPFETLRREMQDDLNGMYPTFQGGIRVTYPPAKVIERSIACKRPTADPGTALPVTFTWTMMDDSQYIAEHKVTLVYWEESAGYATAQKLDLTAPKEIEKFGITRQEKDVWKVYEATTDLPEGRYRYHWLFDDAPHFDEGRPYGDLTPGDNAYKSFAVIYHVEFGIGVSF